jgi:uncharacterized protein
MTVSDHARGRAAAGRIRQEAELESPAARRYLAQLCRHFRHKVPVEDMGHEGRVEFAPGTCRLFADENRLRALCEAEDAAGLARLRHILDEHLQRFAWRQGIAGFTWREPQPTQG